MISFNFTNHDVIVLYNFLCQQLKNDYLSVEEENMFQEMYARLSDLFVASLDVTNPDILTDPTKENKRKFDAYLIQQQEKIDKISLKEKEISKPRKYTED